MVIFSRQNLKVEKKEISSRKEWLKFVKLHIQFFLSLNLMWVGSFSDELGPNIDILGHFKIIVFDFGLR